MPGEPPGTSELSAIRERYARRANRVGRYDPFSPWNVFMRLESERRLVEVLRAHGVAERIEEAKILEVGCGGGENLAQLRLLGARPGRLHGIELLDDRTRAAKEMWPELKIIEGDAAELPYADGCFDVVLQSTVFTSVLDRGFQERMAREMVRVLRRDGWILWYDFRVNNPWNPDVRGVPKRRVKALFPGMASVFYPVTLAPPLIRALVPRFTWLARFLNAFPCLRTHYWAVLWWPDGTRG